MPQAKETEKSPGHGDELTRRGVRNRNSADSRYLVEYTGAKREASVGYLTLDLTAATRKHRDARNVTNRQSDSAHFKRGPEISRSHEQTPCLCL